VRQQVEKHIYGRPLINPVNSKIIKILFVYCWVMACVFCRLQVMAQMCDKHATTETRHLFANLQKQRAKAILFGHQDDLAYGVGWKYQPGRSDVKETAGDYPAVYGWELGGLENDALVNIDSVPFDKMKQFITQAYERGAVITISWHLHNPLTGKSAWEPAPGTVASILPGGDKHQVYTAWLDKVAAFMLSLKGKRGEYVPVIFRPFHELNGSWFWWGKNNCGADELKQLYRFTETYLRDTKNVHSLLYAYNTDRFADTAAYLDRYPGDEWVDVIGFDIYQKGDILANEKFIAETDRSLTMLEQMAKDKHKIPALTEFGYNTLPDANWWTNVFAKALKHHAIAYALAWRNAGNKPKNETEFYVPFKGQLSAADFKKFAQEEPFIFESKADAKKLYGK
jgi:hypothetical protein